MGCPSTFHLCKSLVFENTKWKQDETKPVDADRYWCVLVQYEGSVNITKLEKAVRERTGASRKGTHLRIAPAERSLELTGFTNNGVSPVGMASSPSAVCPLVVDTGDLYYFFRSRYGHGSAHLAFQRNFRAFGKEDGGFHHTH